MSTNQAKAGKVKPCPNGCGKDVFFESRYGPDGKVVMKFDKDNNPVMDKFGNPASRWWMMEDVSKLQHNCSKKGATSDTFKIRESQLKDQTLLDPPKTRELDVVDIAESQLRAETKINLKVLDLYDDEIQKHWTKHNWPENGQKMGLWLKCLIGMNKK